MIKKSQHGFTLVEMLVALLIAGIFFSVFVGVVLATFETLRTGDERTVAQQNARVAINYISNDIRHAAEVVPLRLEEYRDYATGGFPIYDDAVNPFTGSDVWPIYRESTDSSRTGYIELSMDGGPSPGDEYSTFRSDGMPYDIRAINPNRINLLFFGNSYLPNTQYWANIGVGYDINGDGIPNPNAAVTRVTYEHQLVEPLHPDLYGPEFSGLAKQFRMVVNSSTGTEVQDQAEFVIIRSFEALNPKSSLPDLGDTVQPGSGPLNGTVSAQTIFENQPMFRQPVADHVMNLRFRYWHIVGDNMIEIRYDPDTDNIGGSTGTDDGYYRYFNIWGNEIYVWESPVYGAIPLLPTDYTESDYDSIPPDAFIINGGDTGDDEFERGILLFEGWKFINAVSISVKTANSKTLGIYKSSINHQIPDPLASPDYGMGFIDFGLDVPQIDTSGTLNANNPLYQGADNARVSSAFVNGQWVFDFVEPNMNPNYDPGTFVTLQTFVSPPALKEKANKALQSLRFGLSHKTVFGN